VAAVTSAPTADPRWFRADITGLRTLAIIPVVAFHAGATFIPGGFIGVDVFYVISGFLITTLLTREVEEYGRIRFGRFWSKRIRRLVPAMAAAILFTLVLSIWFGSVLSWDKLATQAVASALYVVNFLFWRESTDYFGSALEQSPFLHLWSLSIEEQFYVLWPILIIAVYFTARRRARFRMALATTFVVVIAFSLAISVWMSNSYPTAAFYLLPARAWEFAAGGLVAILPLERFIRHRWSSSTMALGGLAVLTFGFLTISETEPYPGTVALIPVVGTLLILAGGANPNAPSIALPLLGSPPFRWIGEVSYSWYLWHWPLIIFAIAIFPGHWIAPVCGAVISLAVAALSYRFIEEPVRRGRLQSARIWRTYVMGATATIAVGVVAVSLIGAQGMLTRDDPYRAYAEAAAEVPPLDCELGTIMQTGGAHACILGDQSSSETIAVIGDSHAGHWIWAMDDAAEEAGVRLVFRWRSACPSIEVTVTSTTGVRDEGCPGYRAETRQILIAERPSLVIISNSFGYRDTFLNEDGARLDPAQQVDAWQSAMADQVAQIDALGAEVAVMDDNPGMPFNPTNCIATLGRDPSTCSVPWSTAFGPNSSIASATFAVVNEDDYLGFNDAVCPDHMCVAVSQGIPLYRDRTHLSRAWTLEQVPELSEYIQRRTARQ